jgi:hypothetical protein
LRDIHPDEQMLKREPDFSAKIQELEKMKISELKKYEKTVKRELNEVDDMFNACHSQAQLQALQDRILKSLNDVCKKAAKKCS